MKTKGALLGTMSGSIGGATASRNRGGQYFRQRVVPTNPNSSRQAAVRAIFSGLVTAWLDTLTAAQRAAWKGYADGTPRTNALGDELILTGQQMYIACNTARLQAGLSRVDAAPTTNNRGESPTLIDGDTGGVANTIEFASGALTTNVDISAAASDDGDALLFIGEPVNASINYFKGPYQFAAATSFASTDTVANFTNATGTLGMTTPLVGGQYRPARAVLAYDDGRVSTAYEAICLVIDDTP